LHPDQEFDGSHIAITVAILPAGVVQRYDYIKHYCDFLLKTATAVMLAQPLHTGRWLWSKCCGWMTVSPILPRSPSARAHFFAEHGHTNYCELQYIFAGTLEQQLNGELQHCEPGTLTLIRQQDVHQLTASSLGMINLVFPSVALHTLYSLEIPPPPAIPATAIAVYGVVRG